MITVHGTGCCLVDNLYADCDFSSQAFRRALSQKEGDGGLAPGKLVFVQDFERFLGKPYQEALAELAPAPGSRGLGGPSVVSLAHAAQVLGKRAEISFFGVKGNDESADFIESSIKRIPFSACRLVQKEHPSPFTDVLSDRRYDGGRGERTFINMLGAAAHFSPEDLPGDFFSASIVAFGGTAILPKIHENLAGLLKQAREKGAITFVNLVHDFPSELAAPGRKWKLGAKDDAYPFIDVLVASKNEALKTTGAASVKDAIHWFISRGTQAVVITDGAQTVSFAAEKGVFSGTKISYLPVCHEVERELVYHPERAGDTTGCGDNFAGGVLADIAEQLAVVEKGKLDIRESVIQGIAAGGFARFTVGGIFYEASIGEKRNRLTQYLEAYCRQLVNRV
ncbi:MAG: carbohydrate kinase family protein [Spirochaetes bacterium]|nr:carbohydrate kinase family protein [Spirochaetota bacterium]